MTEDQITLVKQSWARVEPIAPTAAYTWLAGAMIAAAQSGPARSQAA